MENFFDVATKQELIRFFDYADMVDDAEFMAFERKQLDQNPDVNRGQLAWLYHFRGDEKMADTCLAQIKDNDLRFEKLAYLAHSRNRKELADSYIKNIRDPERRLLVSMSLYECQ